MPPSMTRQQALRLLGLPDSASETQIDTAIKNEYRTWSARTNAPDFDARTEAQRRLNDLAVAETVLLGQRQNRRSAATSGPGGPPVPEQRSGGQPPPPHPAPSPNRSPAPAPPSTNSPPPPAYRPPAQTAPPPQVVQGTASTANWALVLGILSVTCCGFVTGIAAIYLGNKAKNDIAQSGGRLGGSGSASAGIVLGWIGVVFSAIAVLFSLAAGG